MPIKSIDWLRAVKHLSKDKKLGGLIKKHGELKWEWGSDLFSDLIESIVNQQLSGKAAATIFGRFKKLFTTKKFPSPSDILKISDEKIRTCGISLAKIKYIKGLCQAILAGNLNLDKLPSLSDEEVITELIKLKGIGKWTAEMILMFSLKREDVFSLGDLGLRKAVAKSYGVKQDDFRQIEKISQKWKPYRTIASRYLWKSLEENR
ncbi:DNA-3-methyladenine glycosylase 2 family protein [Candidatus Gottesmanbacteria bacterium]|nr:DNA-3-methyladenine glycosylase 2 family protein [Candidatus Gottesmanbacteria bacterium]